MRTPIKPIETIWRIFKILALVVALGLPIRVAHAQTTNSAPRPRIGSPEPADPQLPTLFLIGDSTVRNGAGNGGGGQWGWGEPLVSYFDKTKINVVNRAVGGLSSRTYLTGGYWDRVMAMLKPGDFVMMQFGHNDSGALNDEPPGPLWARGTLRGVGEETKEIDNVLTKQHEIVHTFGWYEKKFIADARTKGATPIVCSLIPRNSWRNGKAARNSADYGGWAALVAQSEKTGFVDLNEIIACKYDELGREKVDPLFVAGAGPHTSLAGAELNAQCVIAGLKGFKESPLATYFSEKCKDITPYTPDPK